MKAVGDQTGNEFDRQKVMLNVFNVLFRNSKEK